MRRSRARRRGGLSLFEAVIAMGLFATVVAAVLPAMAIAARLGSSAAERSDAARMLDELLELLDRLPYEDPTQPGGFGLEPGESASPAHWNDIDDAHGWAGTPPDVDAARGWIAAVQVARVLGGDPNATSGSDQGLRRIDVTVARGGRERARASVLRSRLR